LKDFFESNPEIWARSEYKSAFGGPKKEGAPPPREEGEEVDFL
jgi:hypothetical protein